MEKWSQNIEKHSFQALPESTNDHYKIINNEWTDSSDKHCLTICTVTCFTATMRRLHAYYATLQYRSQSFIGKSALHAYHKLNSCKIFPTMIVNVCTKYNILKTTVHVCKLFRNRPLIPFCWKLINRSMGHWV